MILVGAGGHAREVIDLLELIADHDLFLFDNVNTSVTSINGITVLINEVQAKAKLQIDPRFIIATGNPAVRKKMYELFLKWGGNPVTCIANTTVISKHQTSIGDGSNLMHNVFISNHVQTGICCLLNTSAHLHHNVSVGNFCEIGPAALLLGNVKIGHHVFIGAGAVLLPGIEVGDDAVIGAGSVVTKNVAAGKVVKGNPAV